MPSPLLWHSSRTGLKAPSISKFNSTRLLWAHCLHALCIGTHMPGMAIHMFDCNSPSMQDLTLFWAQRAACGLVCPLRARQSDGKADGRRRRRASLKGQVWELDNCIYKNVNLQSCAPEPDKNVQMLLICLRLCLSLRETCLETHMSVKAWGH